MDKTAEIAEKSERLTRMLAAEGLGGVVLVAQPNFAWLTAGGNNGIDTSREQGACALVVGADGKRFVLASRIEMARMLEEELAGTDFEPVEFGWEEEKAQPTFLADLATKVIGNGVALGSDLPLGPNVKAIDGAVSRCRYQLTTPELARYRQLGRDAGEVLGQVARSLTPGVNEQEIARRVADASAARGIRSVVTLVAADGRIAKFRHPVPTEKSWERVVMLVSCSRRLGLVTSLSRIVCAGEVPEELKRRMDATARVNAELLAATRPGVAGSELYRVAAGAYAEQGFPGEERLHHQGGAAGYRTREWVAHPASTETVQNRQAFAWNPTVTGSKVEETCIASVEDVEVITKSPDWPQISVRVGGREYLSPDVLSL